MKLTAALVLLVAALVFFPAPQANAGTAYQGFLDFVGPYATTAVPPVTGCKVAMTPTGSGQLVWRCTDARYKEFMAVGLAAMAAGKQVQCQVDGLGNLTNMFMLK